MIIGINGKIGSGKDTVGSIVQYLTSDMCRIDNFTFQEWLNYGKNKEQYEHKWETKKFAGKLKTVASLLTGVPVEKFEDQEFKKLPMGLEWEMTYREFLQKLGTEAMRDGLHKEVWVNALFADYKAIPNKTMDESFMEQFVTGSSAIRYTYPNWIITDMRFPNEIAAVELREGITIRVNRNNGTRAIDTSPHPSETALDDADFHYEIMNDGTIEDLVEKVREILIKEEII